MEGKVFGISNVLPEKLRQKYYCLPRVLVYRQLQQQGRRNKKKCE